MKSANYTYLVKIFDAYQHYFEVQLEIQSNKQEVILNLPAWTPGSYMIRDYSTHLHQFSAIDKMTGRSLIYEQTGLHTWKVTTESNLTVIRYLIYAFEDYTVRTNYLVSDFGFINSAGLFLYEEGNINEPVIIKMDTSNYFSNIFTPLKRLEEENQYFANDFDELYDSPIHLSNQNSIFFEAEGCEHELFIEGNISFPFKEKLAADLKIITEKQIQLMGGSPNKYYLFILNLSQPAYGGLEHKACSVNYFSPEQVTDEDEYKKLLELLSHEYFHLWNVKRIRPIALGPFDYQVPNLTRELWIAEGATSFYDIYFLYTTNFLTKEEFISRLQSDIFSMEETDSETWMSLEDSSFTAWNKYYKRNGNSHNTSVSYYTKGGVLVLAMILFLLRETENRVTFLDILKSLYQKFHVEKQRGFTKLEFFDTAKQISGIDLKLEFERYLVSPIKFPIDHYLSFIGLTRIETDLIADIGFRVKEKNGNLFVGKLIGQIHSPSVDIQLEDEILAINGKRMSKLNFDRTEKQLRPKERVHILLSRFGQTKEVMLETGTTYKTKKFVLSTDIAPEIKRVQENFFLQK
ncbi:M61 family peptidase [Leptospira ognonensis]|uniref:M61 family peptidase n=1 Tax=Leptospira ognonensis TaxID=2484945 RepID=A0A4R9K6K0_9LEPT|nr:M61 family metallopeptidase [Leptospira ognonensis]TGL61895.1 M61 family peptidase [Leptospira ognonensis]